MELKDSGRATRGLLVATVLLMSGACGGGGGAGGSTPTPSIRPLDSDGDTFIDSTDCAPTEAGRWQLLAYRSVDQDGDGRHVNTSGQLCSGASLPASHASTEVPQTDADCDDTNASAWQRLGYVARDADGDSFWVSMVGEVCSGSELAAGYAATSALAAHDCDDQSASAWRYMAVYHDVDGDGVGSGGAASTCVGTGAPAGFSLLGYDPIDDPSDPNAAGVTTSEQTVWMRFPH